MLRAIALSTIIALSSAPVARSDTPYRDPQDRFSITYVGDWQQAGTPPWLSLRGHDISFIVVTIETEDLSSGIETGLRSVGFDPAGLREVGRTGWNRWTIVQYDHEAGRGVTIVGQSRDDYTLLLIGRGSREMATTPPQEVIDTLASVRFAGSIELPDNIPAFEAFITEAMEAGPPALSVVLATPQEVVYARGFGLADGPNGQEATPESVYQWGSITKTVTATAVLQLVEHGLVDLDAPVSDYLDYVPAEPPVTVRNLLTHASGFPEDANAIFRLLRLEGEAPTNHDAYLRDYFGAGFERLGAPGTVSVYANPNFILLGELVANRSGMPYADYVRQRIFDPLGMERTGFGLENEGLVEYAALAAIPAAEMATIVSLIDEAQGGGAGATYFREIDDRYAWLNPFVIEQGGAGGLVGPVTDLARFGQMLLNGGTIDGVRILAPASVALLREPQNSVNGTRLRIGLAWHFGGVAPHAFIEHDGGGPGLQAKLRLYPDDGLAVALLANGAGVDRDEIADAAAYVFFAMSGR